MAFWYHHTLFVARAARNHDILLSARPANIDTVEARILFDGTQDVKETVRGKVADQEALLARHHDVTQGWSLSQAIHVTRLLDLQRVRDQILAFHYRPNIEEAEHLASNDEVPSHV